VSATLERVIGGECFAFGKLRTVSSSTSEQRAKGLTRSARTIVEVDEGTGYELVLGLRMLVDHDEEPASYAAGPSWFDSARELSGQAVLDAIERYSGGHEILFGYLLALVAASPRPTAAGFVDELAATSSRDLRHLLLGGRLTTYRGEATDELVEAAARGDAAAGRALLATCLDWQRAPYEHVLSLDADEAKDLLLRACRGWHENVLHPDERETARVLRRSARAARALAERLPPEELVDVATAGIRYVPEPGIERILLVPHVVSRPWSIFTEAGATKIICYGVAEQHVTGDAPPDPLVLAYKALGDETRLRILRRLAEGPAALHELTELLGLAKSTVHGHLLVLRTGGLVVADVAKKTGYRLRRETLAESAALLETYLEGTEEAE
jgi:DNA-binding transcriptional ArsR family regulator